MKFSASRDIVLQGVQAVVGVVERRQTMPILSNVLLELAGNKLTITGTDLELELRHVIEVNGQTDGSITVPARKLFDICKGLKDGSEISMQIDGSRMQIRSGRSRFVLATLPAAEFPVQDDLASQFEVTIDRGALQDLLQRTQFAMAQQDVRFYLNGLLLEFGQGLLRAVATDGHRLALSDADVELSIESERHVIVPRKAVLELQRLLGSGNGDITITLTDNSVQIDLGSTRFTSKLIDGKFPDYSRVIPNNCDKWVSGNRDELRTALQRAAILSNEKFRGVRLALSENRLVLQTHNPEHEEAEEEIEVEFVGDSMDIGFNVNYLLDALGCMSSEQFSLGLRDSDHSGLLSEPGDDSSKYVIMPMRL